MTKNTFAVVGGNTLLGRELREVFEALPGEIELKLIDAEEGEAVGLVEDAGEAVVVSPLDAESLSAATVVLCAGGTVSTRRVWELLTGRKQRPFVVDLSGSLAATPG
ncbi:MAG: hypothetical protein KJZ70_13800, partial [Bryobacterales bacterium]|nr:hypothetical protein [Bryobacterales bacterium]